MKRCTWCWGSGLLFASLLAVSAYSELPADSTQATDPLVKSWQDLAADDAGAGYRALWQLVRNPNQALATLRQQLEPAPAPDLEKIQKWITDLANPKYAIREQAGKALAEHGELAEPALRKVLDGNPDLETKQRVEILLDRLQRTASSPDKARQIRAVEVLEMIGTREARTFLQELTKGFPHARLTMEAKESLERLEKRPAFGENYLNMVQGSPPAVNKDDPLPFGARARLGTTRFRFPRYVINSTAEFSADNQLLVTLDGDSKVNRVINIWDVKTGKLRHKLDYDVSCLAVAPKAALLAIARPSRDIVLWDWREEKEVGRIPLEVVPQRLGFSADGNQFLATNSDNSFRVWDVAARKETKLWKPADNTPLWAFSPHGSHVAVRLPSGKIQIIGIADGSAQTIEEVGRQAGRFWFSPDGKQMVGDGGFRIWDVATGKPAWLPNENAARSMDSVAFSPDGKLLAATPNLRQGIWLWDAQTGKFLSMLPDSEGFQVSAFSADSTWLAGIGQHSFRVWDLQTGQPLTGGVGPIGKIRRLAWSPTGDTIATGDEQGSFRLWNPATGKQSHVLVKNDPFGNLGLSFSADGKWLCSAAADDSFRLWETATGKQVFQLPIREPVVIQVSPDGRTLYSWGQDFYLRHWDRTTGKLLKELRTQPDGVKLPPDQANAHQRGQRQAMDFIAAGSYRFTPDGRQFVLCLGEGKMHFFDVATGKEIRVIKHGARRVDTLAISPSGKHFALREAYFNAFVSDLASGKTLFSVSLANDWGELDFSTDGRSLAFTSGARVVLVETTTGKTRLVIDYLPNSARTVAFSPDGRFLVTGMNDTTALVWDLRLLAEKATGEKSQPKKM